MENLGGYGEPHRLLIFITAGTQSPDTGVSGTLLFAFHEKAGQRFQAVGAGAEGLQLGHP